MSETRGACSEDPPFMKNGRVLQFKASAGPLVQITSAIGDQEIREVQDFEIGIELAQERYGLKTESAYWAEYRDTSKTQFLLARGENGKLVADFRIRYHYDVLKFGNLTPDFRRFASSGSHLIDVGLHLDLPEGAGFRAEFFESFWTVLMKTLSGTNADGVYAQSRPWLIQRFLDLGFQACSCPFEVEGWKDSWVGIWIPLREFLDSGVEPRQVERAVGAGFNQGFWGRVRSRMADDSLWTEA